MKMDQFRTTYLLEKPFTSLFERNRKVEKLIPFMPMEKE